MRVTTKTRARGQRLFFAGLDNMAQNFWCKLWAEISKFCRLPNFARTTAFCAWAVFPIQHQSSYWGIEHVCCGVATFGNKHYMPCLEWWQDTYVIFAFFLEDFCKFLISFFPFLHLFLYAGVALCPNNNTVHIYAKSGNTYTLEHTLAEVRITHQ